MQWALLKHCLQAHLSSVLEKANHVLFDFSIMLFDFFPLQFSNPMLFDLLLFNLQYMLFLAQVARMLEAKSPSPLFNTSTCLLWCNRHPEILDQVAQDRNECAQPRWAASLTTPEGWCPVWGSQWCRYPPRTCTAQSVCDRQVANKAQDSICWRTWVKMHTHVKLSPSPPSGSESGLDLSSTPGLWIPLNSTLIRTKNE